jgi:hypothetical protein
VSALAHYLEDAGLPTVAISLIRLHTEKVGSPRALWVPFELGRPIGAPKDAAFQRRVITAALGLVETATGPGTIEDFPDDDPTGVDLPGWQPPFALPAGSPDDGPREDALRQEIEAIAPYYERFVAADRRTTVGLSGLAVEDCIRFVARFLAGAPLPDVPLQPTPVQVLRWAVDDLKAYYFEAMLVDGLTPASRQMQTWFWDRTRAAQAIIALRKHLLASDDKRAQAIGRMNMVPGAQVLRLGLN